MGIWDKDKRTFSNPNELNNEELVEFMFEGTGLAALDLDQDPQTMLKNKMGNFHEANFQKSYAQAQGKYDKTVNIASRSRQIGRKLKGRKNTESPPGLNIASSEDP